MKDRGLVFRVGAAIARRRKARGLTQAQIAEMIGVEKETISRMENGVISPTLPRLQQIADIFGCSPVELLHTETGETAAHAQYIGEIIQELSENERILIVGFVTEVVRLLKTREPTTSE
ncbi:helix-turn-helix domain-containing protein [Stutzerimonas kirkiae]|uniref:XRE family transcriptional regulator n=1 Tax=Stutzerimonas kirkiae TaxID=2211392 RepID=A0A4Q9R1W8_9GAMM|nr:helix-turn-helix transcriptional regulator [Stutzerimonas kirkiae]TBU91281.1 XRE family transcriptional regulator [Stutzerimonas kirkiae]TBV00449.1 XRE family transcriptional regulator [Stutzerimonas kirkiae]TBV11815.1 XRE family transcriptional regulator [Stutzerimonas kirkiae]TBV15259.1 XRE family transcriptional regulator [Stutzerimonas kirkiae]